MNNATTNYDKLRQELLNNPEVKEEYDSLEPTYQMIRQIIAIRNEQNLTQTELAQRIGTNQSHIARLESGNYNPSLQFLNRVAKGLGKKLSISFD